MYKKDNFISLKFILGMLVIFCVFIYYVSTPDGKKHTKKKLTFEEQLEYRTNSLHKNDKSEEIIKLTPSNVKVENQNTIAPPPVNYMENFNQQISTTPEPVNKGRSLAEYNQLLDKLKTYPIKNQSQVQSVVNEFLKFKGYPENTVIAVAKDIDQSRAKTHENYMVANFDFSSGNLNISPKMLFELDNRELIAILAHELDHFDKLANICNSMGITEYAELFKENGIPINTSCWIKDASFAKSANFDAKFYQDALKRFLSQNDLELTSSYSDFYKLSENLRNPLEISAYKESDYIYDYYKIKREDGPIKKLIAKFNEVDWAIYKNIENDPVLNKNRILVFDYYFLQAILARLPQFTNEFNNCVNNENGDLTKFWLAYENSVGSFYHRDSIMDKATYDKIYSVMEETERKSKQPLTQQDILKAFKYKINTLLANLVYPNAVKNLRTIIIDYLTYLHNNGLQDPDQELKSLITLICIDNELYTNNNNKDISLYYLKMPEEIAKMYDVKSNKNKFMFIYKHPAFVNKKGVAISESNALVNMLNSGRLDIRIRN